MTTTTSAQGRHQRLADLTTVVNAPGIVLSQPTGDMGVTGIEGFYLDDRRILTEARLHINGRSAEHLVDAHADPASAEFTSLLTHVVTSEADFGLEGDAQIEVVRRRRLHSGGMLEQIDIRSLTTDPVELSVELVLATDGSDVSVARTGASNPLLAPNWIGPASAEWTLADAHVRAEFSPTPTHLGASDDDRLRTTWVLTIAPRTTVTLLTTVTTEGELDHPLDLAATTVHLKGSAPLVRLFDRSFADARALIRADGAGVDGAGVDGAGVNGAGVNGAGAAGARVADAGVDRYMAAGAPWYLTLFGRDSLWSARMMIAFEPELAIGTLRALARRQGVRDDPATAEQPGKILHEARRQAVAKLLPATYYGTADATALWIILLVEAWRWGLSRADTESFLPALRAALSWIEQQAEAGGGFIEYHPDPNGLSNQGWKDSRDAIHDHAGQQHDGPVALAEVQGYAHLAVIGAADLLEEFGDAEAEHWRAWAAGLRHRFAERFWAERDGVRFPATALIAGIHPADSATSNMGHLLGTGILTVEQSALVAERLGADDLTCEFGLRTLSTSSPRYNPFSYHNGSIWPHDTAIAIRGLAEDGHAELAKRLADGILSTSESVDSRLPELWSGEGTVGSPRGSRPQPIPYPTACSPQAWSSASIASLVVAALGLRVDVPAGTISLKPLRPLLLGAFTVRGIRVGDAVLDVRVDESGNAHVLAAPPGLTIDLN